MSTSAGATARSSEWTSASQSISGNRAQAVTSINTANVGSLGLDWTFTDHGDVSATPTVADGAVYFPDFGGYLNAVNAKNGHLIWEQPDLLLRRRTGPGVPQQPPDRRQRADPR